jgi:RHS repeat-associated protein
MVTRYEYDNQSRLSAVLYPWTKEKAEADRKEAEEAGLYFTPDRGNGERYTFYSTELSALREIMNKAGPMRGNAISSAQLMWRERFTYDKNGNRLTRTTPWGTIAYEYDAENHLIKRGDVVYTNDKDGNVLIEKGLRYEARYQYNGQNRMAYSEVTNHIEKTHTRSVYAYDAFGRRTVTETIGQPIRTVYDGQSFEVIREGETFRDGSLTTRYATGSTVANGTQQQSNQATGERYRWISDGGNGRTITEEGYTVQSGLNGARGVTLYGKGEAVAMSYSSSTSSRSMYLGKDATGSVRSVTVDTGALEERYEYDAFGQPYTGELGRGMNLGYMSKPYNQATGLYNYGYRDYKPIAARFTTIDPIRDGNNWFAYVNNDPVNWIDPWGLQSSGVDLDLHAPGELAGLFTETIYHPPNTFIVVGHGNSFNMCDDRNGSDEDHRIRLDAEDLAKLMIENGYKPGMAVILYSCNTGAIPPGKGRDDIFAQKLADYLSNYFLQQINVFAPDNKIAAVLGYNFRGEGFESESFWAFWVNLFTDTKISRNPLVVMEKFKGRF